MKLKVEPCNRSTLKDTVGIFVGAFSYVNQKIICVAVRGRMEENMKISMKDGSIREVTFEEELGRNVFRHTSAHILAQAVKRLYPETKCAIGPAIADGFYYDFEFDFEFSEERFEEIEAEMRKIVKENLQLRHYTLSREEAIRLMEEKGEPYKVELIQE